MDPDQNLGELRMLFFDTVSGCLPGLDSAFQVNGVLVTQHIERSGRQRRPSVRHSYNHDFCVLVGDDLLNMKVKGAP